MERPDRWFPGSRPPTCPLPSPHDPSPVLCFQHTTALYDAGRSGGIEAAIALLRELGEHRDVQENACWLLALLSQVAEFSRR